MKAVLIDPHTLTVTDIDVDTANGLRPFYDVIGCEIVEFFHLGQGVALVIDEEGMLREDGQAFFRVDKSPIAGRAVMVTLNDEADSGFAPPPFTASMIAGHFATGRGIFGWLDGAAEAHGMARKQQEEWTESMRAQGATVDDCGMAAVATFGGDK